MEEKIDNQIIKFSRKPELNMFLEEYVSTQGQITPKRHMLAMKILSECEALDVRG